MNLILSLLISLTFAQESSNLGFEATYQTKVLSVQYFTHFFGHLHQNPSRYSTTLTTIPCGQPVKLLQKLTKDGVALKTPNGWVFVSVGPYEGYLQEESMSPNRDNCFVTKYPKFFELINLDLSETYYWGRLYDQYVRGRSKVK